ncbi:hypothetical protein WM41_0602 [Corynebacterium simulans]|uniref:Uncharacterized protein n=1 Tax=Corynebacterium simulans TaxID=146827 RepID=A0ABR5VBQ3_9CORY|nr:hypothetical protein WM41_0602 [Corynebacterium simulans]
MQHLDAALFHAGDELIVVALRFLDPQDVVEKQLLAVVWSEPLVCQAGAADHYLAEFAYL